MDTRGAGPLSVLELPRANADTYGRRLKRCIVPMRVFEALLSLDGQHSFKMNGWPEGARVVGAYIMRQPFAISCELYSPDFPVVPYGEMPSLVKVTATRVN